MANLNETSRRGVRAAPGMGLIAGIVVLALLLIGLFWWASGENETGVTVTESTTEETAPAAPQAAAPEETEPDAQPAPAPEGGIP